VAEKKYSHKQMKQMMKEDEFASSIDKALHWIKQNRGLVIGAAVALFAATAVYVIGNSYTAGKQDRSEKALAKALEIIYYMPPQGETSKYESREAQMNAALTELDHVMETSPTASVMERAQFYRADVNLKLENEDKGMEDLKQLYESTDGLFHVIVSIKYAGVLENRGNLEEAISVLGSLDDMPVKDALLLDYALLKRGQMQARLGDTEDARIAFTRIVDEFPESAFVEQAQNELDKSSK